MPEKVEFNIQRKYNNLTNWGCDDNFKVLMYLRPNLQRVFKHILPSTLGHKAFKGSKEHNFLFE